MGKINHLLFASLPSSHLWCKDNLSKIARDHFSKAPASLVSVRARSQSHGIGRRFDDSNSSGAQSISSNWISPPGGLYLSCIFPLKKPDMASGQLSIISTVLSLIESIVFLAQKQKIATLSLRWPNDLYGPKGKIGGVLTSTHHCPLVPWPIVIVSIGLNVGTLTGAQAGDCDAKRPPYDCLANHCSDFKKDPEPGILLFQETIESFLLKTISTQNNLNTLFSPKAFWMRHGLHFGDDYRWYKACPASSLPLHLPYQLCRGTLLDMDEIGRITCKLDNGKIELYDAQEIHRLEPQ